MEDLGRKDPGKGYVGLQVHLKEDLRDPSTVESDALGDNQPPVEKEEKIPRKGGGGAMRNNSLPLLVNQTR
jgi:hypothetical protein